MSENTSLPTWENNENTEGQIEMPINTGMVYAGDEDKNIRKSLRGGVRT